MSVWRDSRSLRFPGQLCAGSVDAVLFRADEFSLRGAFFELPSRGLTPRLAGETKQKKNYNKNTVQKKPAGTEQGGCDGKIGRKRSVRAESY